MHCGSHPLNLALRFCLELALIYSLGLWGSTRSDHGLLRIVGAVSLPLIAALVWGVFAVPDDPSRSGDAPVAIPGALRLVLELGLFASAVAALHASHAQRFALALAVLTLVHYALSLDRIAWLLRR
jgi:hypothetical protein